MSMFDVVLITGAAIIWIGPMIAIIAWKRDSTAIERLMHSAE